MSYTKCIIDIDKEEELTLPEILNKMLEAQEKHFKTGPIIGEAREVIEHLCLNLFMREALLDMMDVSIESRIGFFEEIREIEKKKTKEILEKRKKASKGAK